MSIPQNVPFEKVNTMIADWSFNLPPPSKRDKELWLLTITGIAIPGIWQGQIGEHFSGWHDLDPTER